MFSPSLYVWSLFGCVQHYRPLGHILTSIVNWTFPSAQGLLAIHYWNCPVLNPNIPDQYDLFNEHR